MRLFPTGAETASNGLGGRPHSSFGEASAAFGDAVPTGVVGIVTALSLSPDNRDRPGQARPKDPALLRDPALPLPGRGLGGAGRISDPGPLAPDPKNISVLLEVLRAGLIAPSVSVRM